MRMRALVLGTVTGLTLFGLGKSPTATLQRGVSVSIDGDWIGQIDHGQQWQRLNLHLATNGTAIVGTLDLPQQNRNGLPLKGVIDGRHVRLEWQGQSGLGIYDGMLGDDGIVGTFTQGQTKAAFRVIRTVNAVADVALGDAYAGSYELGPRRFIDVAPFYEDEDRPIFFDSETRRTGVLYAVSPSEFITGPSYGVMLPVSTRVRFVRDAQGEVTGLEWQEGGGQTIRGKRVGPHRNEEVTFQNGNITLRGTLTLPVGPGPHPAIVLVHGSGPQRRPCGHWTHYFARHGVAYFCYDKRGTGASTGDLNSASIDDLSADVLAAVQAIRRSPAVDARRIGLIGHSNGGWVAPLAASRSTDIAFLIVKSGSALPVAENLLYELELDMRGAGGFSGDDIAKARALRTQLNRALLTNSGWDDLATALTAAKPERWFGYARVQWLQFVPPPMDSVTNATLNGFRRQIDFDPTATWTRVRCPVLVLLGELDANVPAALSADRIRSWLTQGGNRDQSVRLLARANHGLFEAETGFSREWATLTRYVPGYLDGIADWLAQRVGSRPH